MQDLGPPGASNGSADAINSSGGIAGSSELVGVGNVHAVIWTAPNQVQDLGVLAGGSFSQALAINDSGQVVGSSTIQ
jgi:uncharacterized membrane protein